MKHMRAFANICNAGIDATKMATASAEACALSAFGSEVWHPVKTGFSAQEIQKGVSCSKWIGVLAIQ